MFEINLTGIIVGLDASYLTFKLFDSVIKINALIISLIVVGSPDAIFIGPSIASFLNELISPSIKSSIKIKDLFSDHLKIPS